MSELYEQLAIYGAAGVSTAELLAFSLGQKREQKKMLTLVSELLKTHGVRWLRNASVDELQQMAGLTPVQAARLHAISELVNRFAILETETRIVIKQPDDVADLLRPLMAHLDHEEFRVLVLDVRNQVVANIVLYKGTVDACDIRCAEVLKQAVVRNCPRIIVAHNHPGGSAHASTQDLVMTKQLIEAGNLLGIEVLDHIIIGNPLCTSVMTYLREG